MDRRARSFPEAGFKLSFSIARAACGSAPTADWCDSPRASSTSFPSPIRSATASILALMEDREGNLWVGTETGGLHILRDQRFRNIGTREGLSSDNTTTVVEDGAGTLWVGTSGSGLNALPRTANGPSKARTYTVSDGLLSDVILRWPPRPMGISGSARRTG